MEHFIYCSKLHILEVLRISAIHIFNERFYIGFLSSQNRPILLQMQAQFVKIKINTYLE